MARFHVESMRRELSADEELELIIGPGHVPGETETTSYFESEGARRAAWLAHRDEILEGYPKAWAEERYG
jgi:hypothetical protein